MKLFIALVVLAAVICLAFAQPRPSVKAAETLESVDGGVAVDTDSVLTRKVRSYGGYGGFGGFYPGGYGGGFYPGGYGGYGGYPGFGGGFGGGSSFAQASAGASGFGGGFYG
ncbi:keratin, type II cytoskeletal 2 epidermal-like [Musca domestica]|uniref:Keratin, type II cytoskeletal 2 epidermal-like n=1 Tax=Musca domestica TaxID=7370 RepID=A0A1I8MZ18_MUSDO|nr:keratin, type II cytoskeletal 2 epidermal-like [Musca domestica]